MLLENGVGEIQGFFSITTPCSISSWSISRGNWDLKSLCLISVVGLALLLVWISQLPQAADFGCHKKIAVLIVYLVIISLLLPQIVVGGFSLSFARIILPALSNLCTLRGWLHLLLCLRQHSVLGQSCVSCILSQ